MIQAQQVLLVLLVRKVLKARLDQQVPRVTLVLRAHKVRKVQ